MSVWGICRCKDEADIITVTVEHMLCQVDQVIVQDNNSTDGTRDLLADLAARHPRLVVCDDPDVAYYQSAKMSALAREAAARGAEWVVPFDADEVWSAMDGTVAEWLRGVLAGMRVVEAQLYDHVAVPATVFPWRLRNGVRLSPWRRPEPAALPKVAVRPTAPVVIEQGNHGAHYDDVVTHGGGLRVAHFPYRSAEQMIRKARNGAAAYAATDLPEHIGQHWRDYGRLSDDAIRDVFRDWFSTVDPVGDGLVFDPPAVSVPMVQEVQEVVAESQTQPPRTCPTCGVNTEPIGGGECPRCSEIRGR